MNKQFVVHLTPDQRVRLQALLTAGSAPATTHTHARILLKADAAPGGPAWKDVAISDALDVSVRTVVRVRQRFVKAGLERALGRPPHPDAPPRKVDGTVEAHLVALVCSAPQPGAPAGPCACWPTGWSNSPISTVLPWRRCAKP
jgi:hypothetical protein